MASGRLAQSGDGRAHIAQAASDFAHGIAAARQLGAPRLARGHGRRRAAIRAGACMLAACRDRLGRGAAAAAILCGRRLRRSAAQSATVRGGATAALPPTAGGSAVSAAARQAARARKRCARRRARPGAGIDVAHDIEQLLGLLLGVEVAHVQAKALAAFFAPARDKKSEALEPGVIGRRKRHRRRGRAQIDDEQVGAMVLRRSRGAAVPN